MEKALDFPHNCGLMDSSPAQRKGIHFLLHRSAMANLSQNSNRNTRAAAEVVTDLGDTLIG